MISDSSDPLQQHIMGSVEHQWVRVQLPLPTVQASAKGWRLVWDALCAAVMREQLRLYRYPLRLSFNEVLWLVNNWLSKAKRPEVPMPGTLRVDRPPPCNTLKFTDQQAEVLRIVIGRLFDGTLTLNPTTGAMFPVTGSTKHADHAAALSPDAIAQPQRGSRPW